MSNSETLNQVLKGYRLPKPEKCPENVYQLMTTCWNQDAEQRPNFKQIYATLTEILNAARQQQNILPISSSTTANRSIGFDNGTFYNDGNPSSSTARDEQDRINNYQTNIQ